AAMTVAEESANHHIVEHRHILERGRHLEGAPDACARMRLCGGAREVDTVEQHAARRRHRVAGKAIEEGGLAGAVGTDQPEYRAFGPGEIRAPPRQETAECLGDVLRAKQHAYASSERAPRDATIRACRRARTARATR